MYKIFKVTYNDGSWHSGDLPHFYYIAKSEEEVIDNSKEYQDYLGAHLIEVKPVSSQI